MRIYSRNRQFNAKKIKPITFKGSKSNAVATYHLPPLNQDLKPSPHQPSYRTTNTHTSLSHPSPHPQSQTHHQLSNPKPTHRRCVSTPRAVLWVELTCRRWGGARQGCSVRPRLRGRGGRALCQSVRLLTPIKRGGDGRTSKQSIPRPIHLPPRCHHLTPNLQLRRKRDLFPNLCNTPFISII